MNNDSRGLRIYFLLDRRSEPKRNKAGFQAPIRMDIKYPQHNEQKHLRFPINLRGNPKCFLKGVFTGSEPNAEEKNNILRMLRKQAESLYLKGIASGKLPPKETFKLRVLEVMSKVDTEKTVLQHLGSYIDHMTARKDAGKIKGKSVIYTLSKLKEYLGELYKQTPFTFDHIDQNFETKFLNHLIEKKLAPNTINTFMNRLKMFLNWATINNINRNLIYKSFEMKELPRDIVALSETEVQSIADLKLEQHKNITHGGTKVIRDWFIIATQTGLRYSDLHKIATPELITVQGGYDLRVKTTKTGAEVVIPVTPLLYRIFKEHNFELPLPPSNQKYNAGLKRIAQKAKLKKELSSHVARKSYCTIRYTKGTPPQFIMKISGHRTEKEFYRYIGVAGSENAQLIRGLNNDFIIEHEAKMAVNK